MLTLLALALAQTAAPPQRPNHERIYDRLRPSLYTIEVHSGNQAAKSTLGSGYLISKDGLIVTNYHVVASYIADPDRYQLRAKSASGERPVRLLRFDLVNDLALLQSEARGGVPLRLARRAPPAGAPVVAFGNPEGLGLSLIEGIFNGYAEKGLVDRMLLSMPLNSGMSGGPILNADGEVIGTNVAIEWQSNSLSFGVPASKIGALLAGAPLGSSKKELLAETRRQLDALEKQTSARLLQELDKAEDASISIGAMRALRPPSVFECWDDSETHKEEGVTKSQFSCNLQFTPSVEGVGEVASVVLLLEHFDVKGSAFGFFGTLEAYARGKNQVQAIDPQGGVFSAPRCAAERVRVGDGVWKLTSCASAYVDHPGIFDFDLHATRVSDPHHVNVLWMQMSGFRLDAFLAFGRRVLESVRVTDEP